MIITSCLVAPQLPEDDLSTGYIYARPSATLEAFLEDFLVEHQQCSGVMVDGGYESRIFMMF